MNEDIGKKHIVKHQRLVLRDKRNMKTKQKTKSDGLNNMLYITI